MEASESREGYNQIISTLIKTVNFATVKHKDQRRRDPEQTPFINHPIGVAYILINEAKITDLEVIQCAILHDTVEDTETTFDEIEYEFGKKIRDLVAEVTDDKSLPRSTVRMLQIKNAKGASLKAKLVKLADKLYNLRDLQRAIPIGWTAQRTQTYFKWAKEVVDELRGTNDVMEAALDEIFHNNIIEAGNDSLDGVVLS